MMNKIAASSQTLCTVATMGRALCANLLKVECTRFGRETKTVHKVGKDLKMSLKLLLLNIDPIWKRVFC